MWWIGDPLSCPGLLVPVFLPKLRQPDKLSMQWTTYVSFGPTCWNLGSPLQSWWINPVSWSRSWWPMQRLSTIPTRESRWATTWPTSGPDWKSGSWRKGYIGGRLRWMSSERQFADGLTKAGTRQLLADRLRYGKVKYTWDPDYVASKKKDAGERHHSRLEFAQPSRAKDAKEKLQDDDEKSAADAEDVTACAFELYMMDDGEPIKYENVINSTSVLFEYDLVHENAMAPVANLDFVDEKTTITKYDLRAGWKLFAVLIAALMTPVETASPFDRGDQCLKADEPEEVGDLMDFLWFGAAVVLMVTALGALLWWIGYRSGKHYMLQFRHVRSDRLARLNAEARWKLLAVEKENKNLQEELRINEVLVAELTSLKTLGVDVVRRARNELQEHLLTCPRNHQICVAPVAGRVWHAHRDCSRLRCAVRIDELPPCAYCADGALLNVANDNGVTLLDELHEWLRLANLWNHRPVWVAFLAPDFITCFTLMFLPQWPTRVGRSSLTWLHSEK